MTDLRESIAGREHEQWGDWMRHFFGKCALVETDQGKMLAIPPAYEVALWTLINTKYADLPDDQKNNDRAEADKILAIIKPHVPSFNPTFPNHFTVCDIPFDWDYEGDGYKVEYLVQYPSYEFVFARPVRHTTIPVEERALIQVRMKDIGKAKGYLLDADELVQWYLGTFALMSAMLLQDIERVEHLPVRGSTSASE